MKNNQFHRLDPRILDLPIGLVVCTYEEYPKVRFINSMMKDMLKTECGSVQQLKFIKENIFFLVPHDEREYVKESLEKSGGEPQYIEHQVVCCDGVIRRFAGWISASEVQGEDGKVKYYLLSYMPDFIVEKERQRDESYLSALRQAYDLIFDLDLDMNTIKCIYSQETLSMEKVSRVRISLDFVKDYCLDKYIEPEYREKTKKFLDSVIVPGRVEEAGGSLQMESGVRLPDGMVYHFSTVAVALNKSEILICVRNTASDQQRRSDGGNSKGTDTALCGGHYVKIRTFGYFDVFVDNEPVRFTNQKEKELLAILVDRKGGTVTTNDAIALLFEDEVVDEKLKAKYRKLAMGLKQTMEKYGVGDLIVSDGGVRHLNTGLVDCDYYRMVDGDETARKSFADAYMLNYTWAEETLATLLVATA